MKGKFVSAEIVLYSGRRQNTIPTLSTVQIGSIGVIIRAFILAMKDYP